MQTFNYSSFEQWNEEDLCTAFGLRRLETHAFLDEWLLYVHEPIGYRKEKLEELRQQLSTFYEVWNEDELKFYFISQMVGLVTFTGEGYNAFNQRIVKSVVNEIVLKGRVEVMVARGLKKPRQPYFFIHEFKQNNKGSGDTLGQLLAAMVALQDKNQKEHPILGTYVIGESWRFVVLDGATFAVSGTYSATRKEDILAVYSALVKAKMYIEKWVAAEP